jgi:hypothetical protein
MENDLIVAQHSPKTDSHLHRSHLFRAWTGGRTARRPRLTAADSALDSSSRACADLYTSVRLRASTFFISGKKWLSEEPLLINGAPISRDPSPNCRLVFASAEYWSQCNKSAPETQFHINKRAGIN